MLDEKVEYEYVLRLIDCLAEGVLREAQQIKLEILNIKLRKSLGEDIDIKKYSETSLHYFIKFSYKNCTQKEFED